MATLLDTNVLLRLLQPNHPHSPLAERSISALRGKNEVLNIASQNLVEFWAVVTRPVAGNGLGFSTVRASVEMSRLKSFFVVLPESPLHRVWERIVSQYQICGKSAHDARLVAAMEVNSVANILTFNVEDFRRYPGITVIDPLTLT